MGEGGSGEKFGGYDPSTFRIEDDAAVERAGDESEGPIDHEVEVNPEKLSDAEATPERRVSPREYLAALERVMTGPERGAIVEKARGIMKKLDKLNPEQRAVIIEILGDTLLELKKASKGMADFYESADHLLDQIEKGLGGK